MIDFKRENATLQFRFNKGFGEKKGENLQYDFLQWKSVSSWRWEDLETLSTISCSTCRNNRIALESAYIFWIASFVLH